MNESEARLRLALGYTLPIVGATFGTIFGLIANDTVPAEYSNWTWVVVMAILGVSLILGTRFSASANNFAAKKKNDIGATIGARTENFVLAIIWSTVLAFMSVGTIVDSINVLQTWSNPTEKESMDPNWVSTMTLAPLSADHFWGKMFPSFLLLVILIVGTILWLLERAKETD